MKKKNIKSKTTVLKGKVKKTKVEKNKVERIKVKEYKEKLFQIRKIVLSELNFLEEDGLKSIKSTTGNLSSYSIHAADMATDNYEREINLDLASSESNLLQQIDEALYKIEKGTYGICEKCEKKIEKKRLGAIPYTKLCFNCKQIEEK